MQLRKMVLMLTALGAVSVLVSACGDDAVEASGCSVDTDCAGTEICHPTAKVCVATCESASDCPDSAKTCTTQAGITQKICTCSTDVLCNGGTDSTSTDLVCSTLDKVCVPKCTSNSECGTGRACNVGTGQCEEDDTSPTTCSGSSQSTCAYGDYCANSTCTAAPVADSSCQNFSTGRPNWSAASGTGPVIYQVTNLRYETNSSNCAQGAGADDAFIVSVRAYRTDADWPSTRNGLAGFFYVNTGAAQFNILDRGLLVPGTGYNRNTTNVRDAEFQVYLCRPTGSQQIQVGFYFTNGNPVCETLNR